ncbi:hypothetical protein HY311_03750 [Candidatus Nomurabacteria bacterium]|nr:hypothetical protein [Candidatus Nomurabacteria bacterium]
MGTGNFGHPPEGAFIIDKKKAEFKKLLSSLTSLLEKLSFGQRQKFIAEVSRLSEQLLHTDPELLLEEVNILAQLYGGLSTSLKGEANREIISAATFQLGEISAAAQELQKIKPGARA